MDYESLAKQIARMRDLPGYPISDEGLTEVVNMLWRVAESDEHAARIVTRSIETTRFAATPADIVRIAETLDDGAIELPEWTGFEKPAEAFCPRCGGWGQHLGPDGVRRVKCSCPLGCEMTDEMLATYNMHLPGKPRSIPLKPAMRPNVVLRNPITSADIARAAAEYRAKVRT